MNSSPDNGFGERISRASAVAAGIGFAALIIVGYVATRQFGPEITDLQAIILRIAVSLSSAGLIACAIALVPAIAPSTSSAKLVATVCVLWVAAFSYAVLPNAGDYKHPPLLNPADRSEPPKKNQKEPEKLFEHVGPEVSSTPQRPPIFSFEPRSKFLYDEPVIRLASLVPKDVDPPGPKTVVVVLERGNPSNLYFCEALFVSRKSGVTAFIADMWRSTSDVVWYDERRSQEISQSHSRSARISCSSALENFDYDRSRTYLSGLPNTRTMGPWLVALDRSATVKLAVDFSYYSPEYFERVIDRSIGIADHLRPKDPAAVTKLQMEYLQEFTTGAFAIMPLQK